MSVLTANTDAGSSGSTFGFPRVPVCGNGGTYACSDSLSVIYAKGDGTLWLIANTSADCPNGHSYYSSEPTALDLCPKTCAMLEEDPSGSVRYIAGCVATLCIN
jgi:hypothetical protein